MWKPKMLNLSDYKLNLICSNVEIDVENVDIVRKIECWIMCLEMLNWVGLVVGPNELWSYVAYPKHRNYIIGPNELGSYVEFVSYI
jgi:hypothetical protein